MDDVARAQLTIQMLTLLENICWYIYIYVYICIFQIRFCITILYILNPYVQYCNKIIVLGKNPSKSALAMFYKLHNLSHAKVASCRSRSGSLSLWLSLVSLANYCLQIVRFDIPQIPNEACRFRWWKEAKQIPLFINKISHLFRRLPLDSLIILSANVLLYPLWIPNGVCLLLRCKENTHNFYQEINIFISSAGSHPKVN